MTNLEVLKCQLESEVDYVKRVFETKPYWADSFAEVGHNAIQRCLGMANICQLLPNPVPYEEIEALYEAAREQIEQMIDALYH